MSDNVSSIDPLAEALEKAKKELNEEISEEFTDQIKDSLRKISNAKQVVQNLENAHEALLRNLRAKMVA